MSGWIRNAPAFLLGQAAHNGDQQFTFAQAMQQSVIEKGAGVTQNSVQQMLKNWRNQGLIVQTNNDTFRKN